MLGRNRVAQARARIVFGLGYLVGARWAWMDSRKSPVSMRKVASAISFCSMKC